MVEQHDALAEKTEIAPLSAIRQRRLWQTVRQEAAPAPRERLPTAAERLRMP